MGQNGILINQKFKTILQKNEGYQTIGSKIISGEIQSIEGLPDLTSNYSIYFKYAPITITDLERRRFFDTKICCAITDYYSILKT